MRHVQRRKVVKVRVIRVRIVVFRTDEHKRNFGKTIALCVRWFVNDVLLVIAFRNLRTVGFGRLRFAPNFVDVITFFVQTQNAELPRRFHFKTIIGSAPSFEQYDQR